MGVDLPLPLPVVKLVVDEHDIVREVVRLLRERVPQVRDVFGDVLIGQSLSLGEKLLDVPDLCAKAASVMSSSR